MLTPLVTPKHSIGDGYYLQTWYCLSFCLVESFHTPEILLHEIFKSGELASTRIATMSHSQQSICVRMNRVRTEFESSYDAMANRIMITDRIRLSENKLDAVWYIAPCA